jgi:hypothetical protein
MKHLDLEALKKKAKSSPDGEAFVTLRQTPDARIGVGVSSKPNEPFLEVTLRVFEEGIVNIDKLERLVHIIRALVDAGYTVISESATGVTCERKISITNINTETEKLSTILGLPEN